jgi:GrpB-like predicted nucleotidyltransferase (UPF0157 family)
MINFIQPYTPEWKTEFENLKQVLMAALNDFEVEIQHIGSTSVPELAAKPILDIDIIIKNKTHLGSLSAILEILGYQNKGEQGIVGRFAFRQSSDLTPLSASPKKWQEHHLYVCFSDSLALKNHLSFRNALQQDKKLLDEYAQLKINLVKEPNMTREKYSQRKTDFILAVLALKGLNEKDLNEIKNANQQTK